jgi:hypothetical protein
VLIHGCDFTCMHACVSVCASVQAIAKRIIESVAPGVAFFPAAEFSAFRHAREQEEADELG